MIALGVMAGIWLAGKRVEERGIGTRDDITAVALWAVPAGIVGARLYHVITDWSRFDGHLLDIFKIWKGGLGIWGGIAGGVGVGLWLIKKRGLPIGLVATCVAPALALAQSIGRWGNWWNQELFGRSTTLPWALEISDSKTIEAGFLPGTTFHPTFLYESIGCLVIAVLLLVIDKHFRLRPGRLFFVYMAMYTLMRFFIEGLRVDPAHRVGGLRLNQWTSIAVFSVSVLILIWSVFISDKENGGTEQ